MKKIIYYLISAITILLLFMYVESTYNSVNIQNYLFQNDKQVQIKNIGFSSHYFKEPGMEIYDKIKNAADKNAVNIEIIEIDSKNNKIENIGIFAYIGNDLKEYNKSKSIDSNININKLKENDCISNKNIKNLGNYKKIADINTKNNELNISIFNLRTMIRKNANVDLLITSNNKLNINSFIDDIKQYTSHIKQLDINEYKGVLFHGINRGKLYLFLLLILLSFNLVILKEYLNKYYQRETVYKLLGHDDKSIYKDFFREYLLNSFLVEFALAISYIVYKYNYSNFFVDNAKLYFLSFLTYFITKYLLILFIMINNHLYNKKYKKQLYKYKDIFSFKNVLIPLYTLSVILLLGVYFTNFDESDFNRIKSDLKKYDKYMDLRIILSEDEMGGDDSSGETPVEYIEILKK